jgi:membrane protease YdiL (CAAX protease family)
MLVPPFLIAETEIQSASAGFMVPITLAYLAACGTWLIVKRLAGDRWPDEEQFATDNRWIDLLSVVLVAIGVFGIGALYRAGWLLPSLPGRWSAITTTINLCLPFSPIAVCLLVRKQPTTTIWISRRALQWKLAVGFLAAAVGLIVFQWLRDDLSAIPNLLMDAVTAHSLSHFAPVFLEAVAVAFVFVRLRWAVGTGWAIAIPSLLFALAHVPSGIESGRSGLELASFVVFNTCLAAAIFGVVARSRDVLWIAIPHYVLDVAIGVFRG